MDRKLPLAALMAAAAIAAAGCSREPVNKTEYNNSGKDAVAAQPATQPAAEPAATSAPATADTASPNIASTAATADANGSSNAATGAVSETVTTGKIKAAIAADSSMKDSDVSVTTKDGVVTLDGTVKSQDQIAIATNLAQRQEGVQRVESNITVR